MPLIVRRLTKTKKNGGMHYTLILSVKVAGRNGALDRTGTKDVSTIEFISSVKVSASMEVLIRSV